MKRNLMEELKEGMEALSDQRELKGVPNSAHFLPDTKTKYIAVWADERSLCIKLLKSGIEGLIVTLDKKIIPHLVDALIDLQNP